MRRWSKNKFCYYPAGSCFAFDTKFTNKKLSKEFGFKVLLGLSQSMKGGHTHNHIYNKCHKHIFRSKQARKIDRNYNREWVSIFDLNLKLNKNFGEILHTIFHHNKKD